MHITYLGHAGFCVETDSTIIIMDPWLSPTGAFDAAWFQYPKNHHMAAFVQEKLSTPNKDKYVYISHEHKDHFDVAFLESLIPRDFTLLLADFFRPVILDVLTHKGYACKEIVLLKDNQQFAFQDGFLTLFLVDTELDCDSAILVKTDSGSFLHLNDCKIHERLAYIHETYGDIDVLSAQFSGAVWHPTCFHMDERKYRAICLQKIWNKFEYLAKAIETIQPAVYLPSSGPPCFLDPRLFAINTQSINSYPRAPEVLTFLNAYFLGHDDRTIWPEIMPGDILDVVSRAFSYRSPIRVLDQDFQQYITDYAFEYEEFFKEREKANSRIDVQAVFERLGLELKTRLVIIRPLKKYFSSRLYISLEECKDIFYCVDFEKEAIEMVDTIDRSDFFWIKTPAWQINKVFSGEISWSDFALTFRVNIERNPDIYSTLIHGFITLDNEALTHFAEVFLNILSKKERIQVRYKGKKYSVLRYCPHQGSDLSKGWVEGGSLICPRHQWRFELANQGKCRYNEASVEAIPLEETDPLNTLSPGCKSNY